MLLIRPADGVTSGYHLSLCAVASRIYSNVSLRRGQKLSFPGASPPFCRPVLATPYALLAAATAIPRRERRLAGAILCAAGYRLAHQPGLTEPSVPVKPVRPGTGLVRYETGPNLKLKFEFKKMKNF